VLGKRQVDVGVRQKWSSYSSRRKIKKITNHQYPTKDISN
jgi:hypothetical protein